MLRDVSESCLYINRVASGCNRRDMNLQLYEVGREKIATRNA